MRIMAYQCRKVSEEGQLEGLMARKHDRSNASEENHQGEEESSSESVTQAPKGRSLQ